MVLVELVSGLDQHLHESASFSGCSSKDREFGI
jgi:hypothetical protein